MAGPNLEIFRFGFYMFFPIYIMFKFGDPIWYDTYVVPYKDMFWPPYEETHQTPKTHSDLREELARMKAERIARKSAIQGHPTISSSMPASAAEHSSAESVDLPPAPPQAFDVGAAGLGGGSKWRWPGSSGSSGAPGASSDSESSRLV